MEDDKPTAQREAEALAEHHDREQDWPSGQQVTSPHLGALIPVRDEWTGRRLNWVPDVPRRNYE